MTMQTEDALQRQKNSQETPRSGVKSNARPWMAPRISAGRRNLNYVLVSLSLGLTRSTKIGLFYEKAQRQRRDSSLQSLGDVLAQ